MPTTGSSKMPYPNTSAVPDVPGDLLLLGQRIAKMAQGFTDAPDAAARAALVTNGDAFEGLRVYQIDTKATYVYESSAWVLKDSDWITWATVPTNIAIGTGGSAASVQRYKYINGRVYFDYKYTLGTSGASVGTGPVINLPFSVTQIIPTNAQLVGDGNIYDVSAVSGAFYTKARLNATSASQAVIATFAAGAYVTITATAPITFAAGDIIAGGFWADV